MNESTPWEESLKKSKHEPAAIRLEYEMRKLSEAVYYAGWRIGLEYAVWNAIQDPDKGSITIGPEDDDGRPWGCAVESLHSIKRFSEEAGGWWVYDDLGQRFVTLTEWLSIYEAEMRKTRTWIGIPDETSRGMA